MITTILMPQSGKKPMALAIPYNKFKPEREWHQSVWKEWQACFLHEYYSRPTSMLVSLVACRVVATFSVSGTLPHVQNSKQQLEPPPSHVGVVRARAASPVTLLALRDMAAATSGSYVPANVNGDPLPVRGASRARWALSSPARAVTLSAPTAAYGFTAPQTGWMHIFMQRRQAVGGGGGGEKGGGGVRRGRRGRGPRGRGGGRGRDWWGWGWRGFGTVRRRGRGEQGTWRRRWRGRALARWEEELELAATQVADEDLDTTERKKAEGIGHALRTMETESASGAASGRLQRLMNNGLQAF